MHRLLNLVTKSPIFFFNPMQPFPKSKYLPYIIRTFFLT